MTSQTLLLRQIHPSFVQNGRVTSQPFRPTPKDDHFLSVDNGDKIAPPAAWARFTSNPSSTSAGVMALSNEECTAQQLRVVEDGVPYPEHCYLDYSVFEKREVERKAKHLSSVAQSREWIFEIDRET